ncbi:MAG: extracellular solute-binding protein [Thermodesulfobacteriota bacterium]
MDASNSALLERGRSHPTAMTRRGFLAGCCAAVWGLASCSSKDTPVVVYTALDEMYSRPILDVFTARTRVPVRAVYDTEAAKTTGLVTRLIAEKERARADVFWNNETAQTVVLKKKGVIKPYLSPTAEAIPSRFRDPDGYWTGFAARGRVIIYHTGKVKTPPRSVLDFLKPEWSGKAAIANPLFGTTATHAAALFALWGDEKARAFFAGLKRNKVAILPGNATVRDLVARGEFEVGLTDTDDANGAMEDGLPAAWLFPDQRTDEMGTLVIPNTVALISGGPNPDAGKLLIDHLLSLEVERTLAAMRSIQIPLNPAVTAPPKTPKIAEIKHMNVSFEAVADSMAHTARFIKDEFLG